MDDEEHRNDEADHLRVLGGGQQARGAADTSPHHTDDRKTSDATAADRDQYRTMQAAAKEGVEGEGDAVWGVINNLAKQKKHLEVLAECNKVLKTCPYHEKVLERKVRTLCQMGKFLRAQRLTMQWLQHSPEHPVALKELKRLQTVLAALEDEEDSEGNDDLECDLTPVQKSAPAAKSVPKNTVRVLPPQPMRKPPKQTSEGKHYCPYCDLHFDRQDELDVHCHSDLHTKRLASDESQKWNFRPPPRGQIADDYTLCSRFFETQRCPYGDKCTFAHSHAELEEWRERFTFRRQQLQQARDKQLHGNTFIEQLLEKLNNPEGPQAKRVNNLDFVKIHVNSDLKVNMTTKKCTNAWTFTITSKACLHAVGLLDDANRSYFHISSISVGPKKTQKYQNLENHCQEWINPDVSNKGQGEYVYRVKVVFKTDIYGTFRQELVLGFGLESVVFRDVQVESSPVTDTVKLSKDLELSAAGRWTAESVIVVPFLPPISTRSHTEEQLVSKYLLPRPERLSLSETMMQSLSKDNYRLWMHEMLYLEEMAELGFVQRFNVTGVLQLVNCFLLVPGALSAAKYAREGELFARLKLEDVLSEDSSAGRLILQNAQTAWIAAAKIEPGAKQKAYEAQIEDKGKSFVFLRLSAECVQDQNLTCDQTFTAQIQFQLNRLSKCEMHSAVDSLSTLDIVFPKVNNIPQLPEPQQNVLAGLQAMRLNEQQREAILTITSPVDPKLPPLLIIGPFGTGKTYTLAQAAKLVLEQEGTRILICTHSNSAADLYIKDFFHPYVEEGHKEARPLRIYYRYRWVYTVPEVALQYSSWSADQRQFLTPTLEDIAKHRVVITTLSTARYISDIGLEPGYFTHILIDEAAQALECETLIPLALGGEKTRIVLAGDHLQISPEVYSDYTRQQGFHISFLERLFDMYPRDCTCMVMLCENYRSHRAIVDFTSELFYDQKLIASGKQAPHPVFYPLTFCHARGLEEQHENSTGFYNMSEVYEIVDRVEELRKKWPSEWGSIEDNGVSVVAPYHDQVIRIRNELRKKKIHNISVERVLNVQGKQYRVIIISTVRTRNTCRSDGSAEEDYLDYGFLSNVKLLNTAITRAQSLVMVVGDPLSLCLVGKCRKVWESFLEVCSHNRSLFGITMDELRAALDRMEVAKNYSLNPLAPEFVPNRRYHFTFQVQESQPELAAASQAGPSWTTLVNQQHPATYPAPYQMLHPHFMPYFGMPVYSPYMGPVLMRAPQAGMRLRGFATRQPGPLNQGAQRAEGLRMVDVPQRFQPRGQRMPFYQAPRMPQSYYPYPLQHPLSAQPSRYAYSGYYLPEAAAAAALYQQYPFGGPVPLNMRIRGAVPHPYAASPYQPFPYKHLLSASAVPLGMGPPPEHGDPVEKNIRREANNVNMLGNGAAGILAGGHDFQVLPNVKHVPAHLLQATTSSPNSSRSSTPAGMDRSPMVSAHLQQEGRHTPVSERPYSPANYAPHGSPQDDLHRDRSNSREWEPETEADVIARFINMPTTVSSAPAGIGDYGEKVAGGMAMAASSATAKKSNNPKQLRLTTGFSRQFSDDLPTPTAITDIVRMIEDIDEKPERSLENEAGGTSGSSHGSSPTTVQGGQQRLRSNGRNSALNSLHLNLVAAQQQQLAAVCSRSSSTGPSSQSTPSSDSPAALNGERATYAGVVGKAMPSGQGGLMLDLHYMEPQTPRTPYGFITPGGEGMEDPFLMLRNLPLTVTSTRKTPSDDFSA